MKAIVNIMRQDITTALRDNIVIYLIIAPLLFSFGLRFFLPSVEKAELSFAVDIGIQKEIAENLETYAKVELFNGEEAVKRRVEAIDSVPGVLMVDGELTLIFEGNEESQVMETYKSILDQVTFGEELITVQHQFIGTDKSVLLEMLTIVVIMLASLFGGVVSGFNIVAEKESNAIRAMSVSPVSTFVYIAARGLLALIIGTTIAIASSFIMAGRTINYMQLVIALLASFGITIIITMIMGRFANNQISAIAVIKVLMPIYLTVPIMSVFINEKFHYLFYWLPNYWQFQLLSNIYFAGPQRFSFALATILTFITSTIFMLLVSRSFSKQLKLR